MDFGLADKNALVMGSSTGLGRAIAESLIAEGARVAICARGSERLERAAKEIGALSHIATDLAVPGAAVKLVEMANECGGTDNITVQIAEAPPEAFTAPMDDDPGDTPANRLRWALTLTAIAAAVWLLVHQL